MRLNFHKEVYQFEDVFNEFECNAIINYCEMIGFKDLQTNKLGEEFYRPEVRNDQSCVLRETGLKNKLTERIKSVFNVDYVDYDYSLHYVIRISKYSKGSYCKPHKDGIFNLDYNTNIYTMLMYLNTPTGGETVFHDGLAGTAKEWASTGEVLKISPKTGTVIVFDPNTKHEALECGDLKYCLRADIIIRTPNPPPQNDSWIVD